MSRCRVLRTARRGRLQVAVLRVTVLESNSPEQLVIAVRRPTGWRRLAGLAPPVYSGQGMLGSVTLVELSIAQRIAGGPPEIDATARSWQGEPEGECVRGVEETHRTVCTELEGTWRCLELQVASGDERVMPGPLGEPDAVCAPPGERPAWSIAVDFSASSVTTREVNGAIPAAQRARLGTRPLAEAFDR